MTEDEREVWMRACSDWARIQGGYRSRYDLGLPSPDDIAMDAAEYANMIVEQFRKTMQFRKLPPVTHKPPPMPPVKPPKPSGT